MQGEKHAVARPLASFPALVHEKKKENLGLVHTVIYTVLSVCV